MTIGADPESGYDKSEARFNKVYDSLVKRAISVLIILVLIIILTPDRKTVYLIATSEAGEQAIQTPEFAKMKIILNEQLDKLLEKPKEK